ncbi:MAG: OmpH family outer membrane protein [Magnetococcales bacterium]|nr:OmpH family outer membrane protein [Magnetococcales bacterium]
MSETSFLANARGAVNARPSQFVLTWCLAVALALFGGFWCADDAQAAGGTPTFAYVDVPRVMAASTAAQKARDMLKKKLAVKQQEVDAMEAEIKELKNKLEQGGNMLNRDARADLENNTRRKFREYQRLVEDNQAAIDRENGVWTKKITEALREVIEEIGRERGYTAVFGKGQVLFANNAIDISDQVLKQLNEHTKKWF